MKSLVVPTIDSASFRYFGYRNDIPAEICFENCILYFVAICTLVSLIMGVLTARRRRVSTLIIGTLCWGTFFSLLNGKLDPTWHQGQSKIISSYCMYDPSMFIHGKIGLNVGLSHFNITYSSSGQFSPNISFNNQFDFFFGGRHRPIYSYKEKAFNLGLPNAVIAVAEYMESTGGGFQWGSQYPKAGYFTQVILDYAICFNVISMFLLVLIPKVGIYLFALIGLLMLTSNWVYWKNVPSSSLDITVEGIPIEMNFGIAFYSIMIFGCSNIVCASFVYILRRWRFMKTVSTFFELDYDTPWDHKTIKEDSANRKMESSRSNFYVDSRLRESVKRLRASFRKRRRTKSQGEETNEIEKGFVSEKESAVSMFPDFKPTTVDYLKPTKLSDRMRPRSHSDVSCSTQVTEL